MNETAIQARDRGYADGQAGRPPTPNHGYEDQRTQAYIDGHILGRQIYLADKHDDDKPCNSAELLEADRAAYFAKVDERANEIGRSWEEVFGLIQRMEEGE